MTTGKTEEEYNRISRTWYKVGGKAGDTDTWFYHDMYLRVMPALDFIKSRREWNQKDNLTRPPQEHGDMQEHCIVRG